MTKNFSQHILEVADSVHRKITWLFVKYSLLTAV